MLKKSVMLAAMALALNVSIAKADVVNYVVKNNGVNKSYAAEELQQSFLDYKSGADSGELYKAFLKDLTKGEFVAFQNEELKFVNYEEIQTAFLDSKTSKTKFDLDKFMKEAKGIEVKLEKAIIENTEKCPKGVYFNNKKIEKTQPFFKYDETYVPISEIAEREGAKIIKNNMADVRFEYKGKEYHFGTSMNVYEIDDEEFPISTQSINGVKVPKDTPIISWMSKLYVPSGIIKSIFNEKVSIHHDSKLVYIGQAPTIIPKDTEAEEEAMKKEIEKKKLEKLKNSNKAVTEGWVCPTLNKTSKDDIYEDMKIFDEYLEFYLQKHNEDEKMQTAFYSPFPSFTDKDYDRAMVKTIVGRDYTNEEDYYWNSVEFFGYYMPKGIHDPYLDKLEQINPQVLRYYFPTKWKYLHNLFMNNKVYTIINKHLNFDGRDVYITKGPTATTVYFSKVGGKMSIGRE